MGINSKVEDLVLSLAKNSSDADGFIASGAEAKMLRENFPKHILFTPGVRLPGDNQHDQKRVVTPAESLKFSDKVIMGRSLLQGDVDKNLEKVLNIALKAHNSIGCKGVTRSDFKFYKNRFFLLETNTQPGMTKLSLVPEIAAYAGMSFINLIEWILKDASTRR